jgi:hypothetical protein
MCFRLNVADKQESFFGGLLGLVAEILKINPWASHVGKREA